MIKTNLNKIKKIQKLASLLIILMLFITLFFTYNINYQYAFNYENENIFYNGNREKNNVCIMFNVYWGDEYLEDILRVLENYRVKTTFFIGGIWLEKNPEMLKKIYNAGHEIGSHGYLHLDHNKLSYEQNLEEMRATHKLIKSILNIDITLFAPPSGSFNKATIEASTSMGYTTIMWSKDTIDWRDKNASIIYERATKSVVGGDLILCHPTSETLKALPSILEYYKLNNLIQNKVSEVL